MPAAQPATLNAHIRPRTAREGRLEGTALQPPQWSSADPIRRRLAEIRQQQGWRSAEQLQTPTISPGRDQPHLQDGDAIDQPMTASWDMLGCLPQQQQPQPDAWPQSEDEYLMPSSAGQTSQTSQNAFDDSMFSLLARPQAPSSGSLHPRPPSLPDPTSIWPLGITDENLIRWIDVYFERLYPTLPILKRSSIFARLLSQEHRTNPDFGAMLLALSAFSLIQPVRISEWSSASSRENMVNFMLSESVKMRASVEFGENPSLDAILTSVFLFACLFQRNQHNAAWFRLKEAVELGSVFGLGRSECYANCEAEQKQQRLRIYYLLAVTERLVQPREMRARYANTIQGLCVGEEAPNHLPGPPQPGNALVARVRLGSFRGRRPWHRHPR